jgi:hypothetical protein
MAWVITGEVRRRMSAIKITLIPDGESPADTRTAAATTIGGKMLAGAAACSRSYGVRILSSPIQAIHSIKMPMNSKIPARLGPMLGAGLAVLVLRYKHLHRHRSPPLPLRAPRCNILARKPHKACLKEWCFYPHRKERILVFLNEVGKDAEGSFRIVDGTSFNDMEGNPLRSEPPSRKLRQLCAATPSTRV